MTLDISDFDTDVVLFKGIINRDSSEVFYVTDRDVADCGVIGLDDDTLEGIGVDAHLVEPYEYSDEFFELIQDVLDFDEGEVVVGEIRRNLVDLFSSFDNDDYGDDEEANGYEIGE